MGVITGVGGAVDAINTVRNWKLNTSAEIQAYFASNTKGAAGRIPGNTDWTGSYDAYGHTPVKMPGEGFTFKGSIDGSVGAVGVARVSSVEITCDIAGGNIISHVCNFGANGAIAKGAAVAADSSVPDPPTAIGCKVEIGTLVATPIYTALDDVQRFTITLSEEPGPYVSSSTAGQTKRIGGNIDMTYSIPILCSTLVGLPTENDIFPLRFFINASQYWELKWGAFEGHSDINVDREAAAIVGLTLNGSMTGFTNVSGTPTEGGIWKPGASKWWPA